jgi:hypothetical protein
MALGCLPLVQRYYPHSQGAKRALLLAATLAALLVLLRPPLPIRGGAECPPGLPLGLCPRLWDAGHVPAHEQDDVSVWGACPACLPACLPASEPGLGCCVMTKPAELVLDGWQRAAAGPHQSPAEAGLLVLHRCGGHPARLCV